ncbi:MAG: hypothetical protein AB1566_09445 [Chloroflexota bacterium]
MTISLDPSLLHIGRLEVHWYGAVIALVIALPLTYYLTRRRAVQIVEGE